jgi:hypothetical protein
LQADLEYLIGRVIADGSFGPAAVASMKDRLNKIEQAVLASPTPAPGGMELADELQYIKATAIEFVDYALAERIEKVQAALRTAAQSAERERPPLAELLKEVDPTLADVLTDNAAYVQVIRKNVIEECAKIAAERGWMTGRDIAKEIRSLAQTGVKR